MDSISEKAQSNKPCLRVVLPVIDGEHSGVEVEVGNCVKAQSAKTDVAIVLRRVVGDPHSIDCMYKKLCPSLGPPA